MHAQKPVHAICILIGINCSSAHAAHIQQEAVRTFWQIEAGAAFS